MGGYGVVVIDNVVRAASAFGFTAAAAAATERFKGNGTAELYLSKMRTEQRRAIKLRESRREIMGQVRARNTLPVGKQKLQQKCHALR